MDTGDLAKSEPCGKRDPENSKLAHSYTCLHSQSMFVLFEDTSKITIVKEITALIRESESPLFDHEYWSCNVNASFKEYQICKFTLITGKPVVEGIRQQHFIEGLF